MLMEKIHSKIGDGISKTKEGLHQFTIAIMSRQETCNEKGRY